MRWRIHTDDVAEKSENEAGGVSEDNQSASESGSDEEASDAVDGMGVVDEEEKDEEEAQKDTVDEGASAVNKGTKRKSRSVDVSSEDAGGEDVGNGNGSAENVKLNARKRKAPDRLGA
jgi:hypothetical protein